MGPIAQHVGAGVKRDRVAADGADQRIGKRLNEVIEGPAVQEDVAVCRDHYFSAGFGQTKVQGGGFTSSFIDQADNRQGGAGAAPRNVGGGSVRADDEDFGGTGEGLADDRFYGSFQGLWFVETGHDHGVNDLGWTAFGHAG